MCLYWVQFSCSVVYNSETPWTASCQASLSITNSRSLLRLMSVELVMPSSPLTLCHLLLLPPLIFPSIRVFSNESALRIRWPKCWSFSFNISPSSEHPGDQWRNNSRKNEGMEPKQKQRPLVDVTGDRSKVWCCKEQYCIGTWNVRSMNQGTLEVSNRRWQEWTLTF